MDYEIDERCYEYEERYYKYRQTFNDYILIYRNILKNKKISKENLNRIISFIMLILERHYFLNDYIIKPRDDMFHLIKYYLINY